MSSLVDLLKSLNKQLLKTQRRWSWRHGNPGSGIEYNEIHENRKVSKKVYTIDIARSPQVVTNTYQSINVQGCALKANNYNYMINYKAFKVKGRI